MVRVHNLGQSEIGYLDVATDEASSQQDVLLGVKCIFFKFCCVLSGRIAIYERFIIETFFYFRKHFVDWRLRQWRHQDHRFRTVQDYGL